MEGIQQEGCQGSNLRMRRARKECESAKCESAKPLERDCDLTGCRRDFGAGGGRLACVRSGEAAGPARVREHTR